MRDWNTKLIVYISLHISSWYLELDKNAPVWDWLHGILPHPTSNPRFPLSVAGRVFPMCDLKWSCMILNHQLAVNPQSELMRTLRDLSWSQSLIRVDIYLVMSISSHRRVRFSNRGCDALLTWLVMDHQRDSLLCYSKKCRPCVYGSDTGGRIVPCVNLFILHIQMTIRIWHFFK